eukprot:c31980_g1_i1 orf=22-204(+)
MMMIVVSELVEVEEHRGFGSKVWLWMFGTRKSTWAHGYAPVLRVMEPAVRHLTESVVATM